ncbi:MAG: SIR2 family protein [Neomegalonema sp.]|nr:SIR2 family protein [Neomegalonema sp.]
MWTHKTPHIPYELTAKSIEDHGRISLYRALNISQVIGVTGSGISSARNLPRWNELIELYLNLSVQCVGLAILNPQSQDPKNTSIDQQLDQWSADDNGLKTNGFQEGARVIAHCAETDPGIGELWEVLCTVSSIEPTGFKISSGEASILVDVADSLLDRISSSRSEVKQSRQGLRAYVRLAFISRLKSLSAGDVDVLSDSDPIVAIRKHLRLTRILTLNYDLEQEKDAFNATGLRGLHAARSFEDFVGGVQAPKPANRCVHAANGASDSLSSLHLEMNEPSDLFSFALQGKRKGSTIAHLHGRLDAVESIVISRKDYTKFYLKDAEARRSFDEAMRTLFGGNSVLFIGVGMTEDEILRPLEQFLTDAHQDQQSGRHAFALMRQPTPDIDNEGLSKLWTLSSTKKDEAEKRKINREIEKSIQAKASFFSIDRFLRSGVYTIYYGDMRYQLAQLAVKQLRKHEEEGTSPDSSEQAFSFLQQYARDREIDAELLDTMTPSLPIAEREAAAAPLLSALQSAALAAELRKIDEERMAWWRNWQVRPKARKARFRPAPRAIVGDNRIARGAVQIEYLFLRHRTDYRWTWNPNPLGQNKIGATGKVDWEAPELQFAPIRSLRELGAAAEARRQKRASASSDSKGVRILRATAPRGGGKGAVASLLQRREVHASIFPPIQNSDATGRRKAKGGPSEQVYAGVFMAHLAFSTEFSSVILALSRFLAGQLARIALQEPDVDDVSGALQDLKDSEENARKRPDLSQDGGERAAAPSLADEIQKTEPDERAPKEEHANYNNRHTQALYIDSRIDVPRLALHPNTATAENLDVESVPPHRLDTLRELLMKFNQHAAGGDRVLIALTGLDRICDRTGDGLNPMHRAFFRMITAPEKGEDHPEIGDPPIDIILIAGRPDTPICYLSHEVHKRDGNIWRGPDGPLPEQSVSRKSRTGRHLALWPQFAPFSPSERSRLTPTPEPELMPIAQLMSRWAKVEGPWAHHESTDEHRYLRRQLCTDVALHVWTQTALSELYNAKLFPKAWGSKGKKKRAKFWTDFDKWFPKIRASAEDFLQDRDKSFSPQRLQEEAGIYATAWLLARKKEIKEAPAADTFPDEIKQADLDNFVLTLREINRHLTRLDRAATSQKFLSLFAEIERMFKEATAIAHPNGDPSLSARTPAQQNRLHETVLRHMALFSVPTELWVLYGCPDIFEIATKCLDPRSSQGIGETARWNRRRDCLYVIHEALTKLAERGLIIRISGGGGSDLIDSLSEKAIHYRYALNERLREYYARKMDLSLPDLGESNHYQVSVFCDQPRDLPTPTPNHFRLVKGIVENLVKRTRETLWLTYQNTERTADRFQYAPKAEDKWEKLNEFAAKGGLRRIFQPSPPHEAGDPEYDPYWELPGHFGRIHALPQRLRASYSLVRGAFSLGAISRLEDFPLEVGEQPPFETYRGWLRTLLNAAAGLAYHRDRYRAVLSGKAAERIVNRKPAPMAYRSTDPDDRMAYAKANWHGENAPDEGISQPQKSALPDLRIRQPYYRDEIAWLYNERGLTSLVQGKLYDALPLFDQALHFMRHNASSPNFDVYATHAAERRIELNIAVTFIERGGIDRAREILERLIAGSENVDAATPSIVKLYAEGYLALCNYLSGSVEAAIGAYRNVLEEFTKRGRLRPVSIFNRQLADALDRVGDHKGAARTVDLAIDAAAHAEQRDVYYEALLARASLPRIIGYPLAGDPLSHGQPHNHDTAPAIRAIERAGAYARRMGVDRLWAKAEICRAWYLVREGETETAGRAAADAAALARRNGLGLSKLDAMVLYADVLRARKENDASRNLATEAMRSAEQIGYQTLAAKAQDLLSKLPQR